MGQSVTGSSHPEPHGSHGPRTIYTLQVEDDSIMSVYLKFTFTRPNLCSIMQVFEMVFKEGKASIDPIQLHSNWCVATYGIIQGGENIDSRKLNIIKRQLY